MPQEINFLDAFKNIENGYINVKGSSELGAIQELMRSIGKTGDRTIHEAFGAQTMEPIRLLARYREWTQIFFNEMPIALGEDNAIQIDQPIGSAFISSPEARPVYVRPGVLQWVRPTFFQTKGALEISWRILQTAGWAILSRRMEEVADSLAKQRDTKAKAVIDAAIATVASHAATVATSMTKASVDSILSASEAIGFPITQAAINPQRVRDMTNWVNGSATAFPYFFAPESKREQVFNQLYADLYGGIRFFISHNVPTNMVYFASDASAIGYHQTHGSPQAASDIDIERGVDQHIVREENAYYVGNPYALWSLQIT